MHSYLKANCVQLVHGWEYKRSHKERFASKKLFIHLSFWNLEENKLRIVQSAFQASEYFLGSHFSNYNICAQWGIKRTATNDSTALSLLCSNIPTFKSLDFIWQLDFFSFHFRSRSFNERGKHTICVCTRLNCDGNGKIYVQRSCSHFTPNERNGAHDR